MAFVWLGTMVLGLTTWPWLGTMVLDLTAWPWLGTMVLDLTAWPWLGTMVISNCGVHTCTCVFKVSHYEGKLFKISS